MRVPAHPTDVRRMLLSRLKRVVARKPLLAASLVEVWRVCGKPSCHCYRGQKHHAVQLTYKTRGQTRSVYVPVDFREEVRSWIEEYRRLKSLFAEISRLALALVHSHVKQRRQRRGRP